MAAVTVTCGGKRADRKAGSGIKDVAEAGGWVEAEAGWGRGGDGAVDEGKDGVALRDADAPGSAGIVAEGADLAHVDKGGGDPGGAKEVDDAVGDPALGNAVQGHRHAGAGEGDAVAAEADGIEADAGAGFGEGGWGGPSGAPPAAKWEA